MTEKTAASPDAPISFAINAQYIKDMSFEGPAHPADAASNEPPKIDVNISASTRGLDGQTFEVILSARAAATIKDKHAFLVELAYAGVVGVPPGLPEEALRYLLLVEVPRHLFPFAREIIASATRDGGFPPLLLQPIDFHALYRNQLQQADAPAAGTA
jgi:preprotein translocase subunit SecB